MEFDEVLQHIGEFGKYQKIVYFTACLTSLAVAINNMGIVFTAGTPDHWCAVPELKNLSLSEDMMRNLTIPRETVDGLERYMRCYMFDVNYSDWTRRRTQDYLINDNTSELSLAKCSNGWVYDKTLYTNTIIMQWDLVCENIWMASTATSVYMAGMMIGVVTFGSISDWIGRRKTLLMTVVCCAGFIAACAFSPNIYVFYFLRFMVGLFSQAMFTIAFVLGMELVGPASRNLVGMLGQFFWVAGYLVVAGLAYLIRDWFFLQLAFSSGTLVCLLSYFLVPESARWLFVNNRTEEGEKVLRKAAKVNGRSLPDKLDVIVKIEESKASIIDLVRTPKLRKTSLNMFFNWFVNSLVYYGLSLNTSNLGGNPYINFTVSAASEAPAYAMCLFLLKYCCRRKITSITMVIGGLTLLATLAVPAYLNWISIALAMAGKFCICSSFAIIYVFAAELFPTVVRNVGIGAASSWARAGAVVAPYIGQLSSISKFIPLCIFGGMSIVAGLLALLLPETKGKSLPETIEDGEHIELASAFQDKKIQAKDLEKLNPSAERKDIVL